MAFNLQFYPRIKKPASLIFLSIFIFSCKSRSAEIAGNGYNSGKAMIAADENLKSLIDQFKVCYENLYLTASLQLTYYPQDSVVKSFIEGSTNTMIITRSLSGNEKINFEEKQKSKPEEYIVAYNAIAFITSKGSKISTVSFDQIKYMLQPGSTSKLVFDNPNSGIAKQLAYRLNIPAGSFKNALVVKNAQEVIDYISRTDKTIGCISYDLFSNQNDPKSKKILSKIQVLKIDNNDSLYTLSQKNIMTRQYPFVFPVNIVLGKSPNVARDFVHFLYRQQASKIIEKEGLAPVNFAQRNVTIREELQIH
ncbi:MAG: phosphate transporter substrate-binding protein [Bacteroidota bacterium]|nr:phosphate transporter substrate-binding protein [Bacteroidota bacterium]